AGISPSPPLGAERVGARWGSPVPNSRATHLVSGIFGKVSGRTAVRSSRPSPDLSPFPPEAYPAGERGTDPVSSFNPNSCLGARARTSKEGSGRMPQHGRIVGIDVSKGGVHSLAATAAVRAEHAAGRSGVDCLVACQRGRAGGDGSQRPLRAQLGGGVAQGRDRSARRRPQACALFCQIGRPPG